MVWSSRTSSGCGIFGSSRSFIGGSSFFFIFGTDCGLLGLFGDFSSASNNVRPALGGAAAAVHRRHGLEVEDEGHLKDFNVIFIFFLGILYCSLFLLMPKSYLQKKKIMITLTIQIGTNLFSVWFFRFIQM
jgi:hypothetical protein